jgi:hypothetical protein
MSRAKPASGGTAGIVRLNIVIKIPIANARSSGRRPWPASTKISTLLMPTRTPNAHQHGRRNVGEQQHRQGGHAGQAQQNAKNQADTARHQPTVERRNWYHGVRQRLVIAPAWASDSGPGREPEATGGGRARHGGACDDGRRHDEGHGADQSTNAHGQTPRAEQWKEQ